MIAPGKQPLNQLDSYYPFLDYANYYPFYSPMSSPFFGYQPYSYPPSSLLPAPEILKAQEEVYVQSLKQEEDPVIFTKKARGGIETDSNSGDKTSKESSVRASKSGQPEARTRGQVKLDFRIEWKNENRNIVPNLINQMISFLLKKIKSYKIVKRLFDHIPHDSRWTQKKFYLYMKKIKESVTHYLNENVLTRFLEIHQPKCELYDYNQQLFYMKVCRVAIMNFLQDDAVLISLTSNRMSQAKREIHLIAREALLRKLIELCRQAKE